MDLLRNGEAQWLLRLRQFFASPLCLAAQCAAGALAVALDAQLAGLAALLLLFSVQMLLCDDILVPFAPALLACLVMIKATENPSFSADDSALYRQFLPYWWLVFLPAGALIAHFVLYRRPFVWGKAGPAMLAVSAAVTLGGAGTISAAEYFAGGALYHIFALGFGMLLIYIWLSSAVADDTDGRLERFVPNMMLALGLLAAFMVFHLYLTRLPVLIARPQIIEFQWRNNVSTFLMLALPFPFYKAFKQPAWLLAGLVMYLATLLSSSRGGMLFGTVELALCVLFLLLADKNKRRRLVYLGAGALVLAAVAACLPLLLPFFWPTISRLLQSVLHSDQEVRIRLYERALRDFLAHPLFGVGIGWMGNRDIHPSKQFALCWYHNAPLQILGSMGLAGAAAYLYQYIVRVRIFLRRRLTKFRATLFLAWAGLELMSLVNPGVFAPVPYLLILTILVVVAEKSEKTAPHQ
ncbi:MAG: O-antigen ligase family protein [Oscillospiraceae bacterium]|nr:O-antigen ligase family protein [Oscillospiraceae bacterium]